MTSMQRKQGRKAIHSWKGAGRLFEQWREDLRTLTVELKQPRPQKPTPSEGIRGKDVLLPFSLPGLSCCHFKVEGECGGCYIQFGPSAPPMFLSTQNIPSPSVWPSTECADEPSGCSGALYLTSASLAPRGLRNNFTLSPWSCF